MKALVVASIALLVALGGTGYAAVTLARDSVGTVHIRAGAVTSAKVRDGSLAVVDLSPATRRALRGAQGPAGPQGDRGDAGPAGLTGVETVGASSTFDSAHEKKVLITCPEGKRLLGGGAGVWLRAMVSFPEGVVLTASHPLDDRTWLAAAHELQPTDRDWFIRVNAICAAAA